MPTNNLDDNIFVIIAGAAIIGIAVSKLITEADRSAIINSPNPSSSSVGIGIAKLYRRQAIVEIMLRTDA